jgi:hypothetical protein
VGLATGVALGESCGTIRILERATSYQPVGALPNGLTALRSILSDIHKFELLENDCITCTLRGTQSRDMDGNILTETRIPTDGNSKVRFLVWYQLQKHLRDALKVDTFRWVL